MNKDEILAKEIGILIAKRLFNNMLNTENQGFLFSWENNRMLRIAKDELFVYFPEIPVNMEELKEISYESAKIEFENLKNSFGKELPLKEYSELEILKNLKQTCTSFLLSMEKIDFLKNNKIGNFDEALMEVFKKENTLEVLKNKSKNKLEELCEIKKIPQNIKEDVWKNIEEYWKINSNNI